MSTVHFFFGFYWDFLYNIVKVMKLWNWYVQNFKLTRFTSPVLFVMSPYLIHTHPLNITILFRYRVSKCKPHLTIKLDEIWCESAIAKVGKIKRVPRINKKSFARQWQTETGKLLKRFFIIAQARLIAIQSVDIFCNRFSFSNVNFHLKVVKRFYDNKLCCHLYDSRAIN